MEANSEMQLSVNANEQSAPLENVVGLEISVNASSSLNQNFDLKIDLDGVDDQVD